MNEIDAWAHYTEHQRKAEWINEHDWKIERPRRRALRLAVAAALLALARRIAPVYPEPEPRGDALAQS